MDKFAENIKTLVEAVQPYAWVLLIIAAVVLGVMFAIPSEKSRQAAKAAAPWVIVGVLLVEGGIYIGDWIFTKITF